MLFTFGWTLDIYYILLSLYSYSAFKELLSCKKSSICVTIFILLYFPSYFLHMHIAVLCSVRFYPSCGSCHRCGYVHCIPRSYLFRSLTEETTVTEHGHRTFRTIDYSAAISNDENGCRHTCLFIRIFINNFF